jgi:type VI secretion system protein ImpG
VIPDRTRPIDFEVYQVEGVVGYGARGEGQQPFLPFYGATETSADPETAAYYTVRRVPRVLPADARRQGSRTRYAGHELFLSLVDAAEAPHRSDLRQLAVETLCTNRDLPLLFAPGAGGADLLLESGAPVRTVRFVAGPTAPRPTMPDSEFSWRLINHLSLNYLSLADTDERQGAVSLRELLSAYADTDEPSVRKQIAGLASVVARPVVRRLPHRGPGIFARGLEVAVTFDESAFEGTGAFLLGAVLERFFARYVSVNSFTETVVRSIQRGEVKRWPAVPGLRAQL